MAYLLHRNNPYGPISVDQIATGRPDTRTEIAEVVAELAASGFLALGADGDLIQGVFPDGDAPGFASEWV